MSPRSNKMIGSLEISWINGVQHHRVFFVFH